MIDVFGDNPLLFSQNEKKELNLVKTGKEDFIGRNVITVCISLTSLDESEFRVRFLFFAFYAMKLSQKIELSIIWKNYEWGILSNVGWLMIGNNDISILPILELFCYISKEGYIWNILDDLEKKIRELVTISKLMIRTRIHRRTFKIWKNIIRILIYSSIFWFCSWVDFILEQM